LLTILITVQRSVKQLIQTSTFSTSMVFLLTNNVTYFASRSSLLLHRDYVVSATKLALNVSGLRRSLHYRGMSTVFELFRRAIQREQFKSVTRSDVKVRLFDFPIRFTDLTAVNLSPASPPPPRGLPLPFLHFITVHANLSCTFKVPITRAVPAKHPFPPYISTRSPGHSYGFFYFRKWRTKIDRQCRRVMKKLY